MSRNQKITLDDIIQRKAEVLQDIRIQHDLIAENAQKIFAPLLPSSGQVQNSLIKRINTGIAIFDGVMIGVKMFKNIRNMFQRKRR